MKVERSCVKCHIKFSDAHNGKKRFCSKKCWYEFRKESRPPRPLCLNCGKRIGPKGKRYCSHACRNRSPEGRAASAKSSLKLKGRTLSELQKKMVSQTLLGSHHTEETRKKMSRTRKGVPHSDQHSNAISEALAKAYLSNPKLRMGFGKKGVYVSSKTGKEEKYDSSYELRRFKALDSSELVLSWTKAHGIRIRYRVFGSRYRTYIPDILVTYCSGRRVLEEVKGYIWSRPKFEQKALYAARYCSKRGYTYRVIFQEGLDSVT